MIDQSNGQVRDEQAQSRVFNPNEHLIQIKSGQVSKDYLPVQWRLVWFRSAFPQGTIETEMLHLDLDRETEEEAFVWNAEKRRSEKVMKQARGFAVFRAVVKDGLGGVATGTKSEKAASFGDFIEKAETGAIGRALAALGYGTQFTGDEWEEAHRIVDSPVDRQVSANGQQAPVRTGAVASNGAHSNGQQQARPAGAVNGSSSNGNGASNGNAGGNGSGSGNGNAGGNGSQSESNEVTAAATEQQIASIRKLSEHLGKPMPEAKALSFLNAKKVIQQLTAEYRESKQNSKAS